MLVSSERGSLEEGFEYENQEASFSIKLSFFLVDVLLRFTCMLNSIVYSGIWLCMNWHKGGSDKLMYKMKQNGSQCTW